MFVAISPVNDFICDHSSAAAAAVAAAVAAAAAAAAALGHARQTCSKHTPERDGLAARLYEGLHTTIARGVELLLRVNWTCVA